MAEPIKVNLEVDTTWLKTWLAQAEKFARDTWKKLNRETLVNLELRVVDFKRNLDQARADLREAKKRWDKEAEIDLTVKTERLRRWLTESKRDLRNYVNTGEQEVSRFRRAFNRLGDQIRNIGVVFAGAFAFDRIGRFLSQSIRQFADFEQALARVNTVSRRSDEEIKNLWRSIQAIANDLPVATKQLADAAFNIASAGVDFEKIPEILRLSSEVAIWASTDVTTAFDGIIGVIKGYGLELEQAQKIADLFFKTNELGQTTVGDVASSIQQVAITANLAWVSLEELFGVYSTLTGVTGDAKRVTTQLRGAIQSLIAPTPEAAKAFNELGIETGRAAIQQKGLGEVIREVAEATDGDLAVIRKLIPEREAQTLIAALWTTQYEKFTQATNELTDAQGSLENAVSIATDTTSAKLQVLTNRFENFKTKVGWFLVDVAFGIIRLKEQVEWLAQTIWESLGRRLLNTFKTVLSGLSSVYWALWKDTAWFEKAIARVNKKLEEATMSTKKTSSATNELRQAEQDQAQTLAEQIEQFTKQEDVLWKTTRAISKQKDAVEELKGEMKDYAIETQKIKYENIAKSWEGAFERITKATQDSIKEVEKLRWEIKSIDDDLATVAQDIASRVLELENELKDINIELTSWGLKWEDYQRLFNQRRKAEEELALARANVNQETLDEIRRQDSLSETEKLLEKQAELEAQKSLIQEQIDFEIEKQQELADIRTKIEEDFTQSFEKEMKKQTVILQEQANIRIEALNRIRAAAEAAAKAWAFGWWSSTTTVNNNVNNNISNPADAQIVTDWIINNTQNFN